VWSLEQAIRTNPGGVGHPVQVMTLEKATGGDWMVRELIETDFSEHLQAIADAEAVLAKYRDFLKPSAADASPPGPSDDAKGKSS
jgi:hypothetical protein